MYATYIVCIGSQQSSVFEGAYRKGGDRPASSGRSRRCRTLSARVSESPEANARVARVYNIYNMYNMYDMCIYTYIYIYIL